MADENWEARALAAEFELNRLSLAAGFMSGDVPIMDLRKAYLLAIDEIGKLAEMKDDVYTERNKLVAHLTTIYPSVLAQHPENEEWEDEWRWIVVVNSPEGQLSWHIHDSELKNFSHLGELFGYVWDGHTTEEKYNRLARCADRNIVNDITAVVENTLRDEDNYEDER